MSAVNISSLRGFAQRRGGMMLGRAIRNTEMLGAMARDSGWKTAARTLGAPAGAGAMKGAMIGAGLGAGMSMINDATNNNFNTGSIGRGVGGALRGGLIGGAIGGVGGAGNAMFRGNMNRIASAQAKAAVAAVAPKAGPATGRMARFKDFMTRPRSFRRGRHTNINGRPMGGGRDRLAGARAMSSGGPTVRPPASFRAAGPMEVSAGGRNLSTGPTAFAAGPMGSMPVMSVNHHGAGVRMSNARLALPPHVTATPMPASMPRGQGPWQEPAIPTMTATRRRGPWLD